MGFKDFVAADLDVFLNTDEHASMLDIDGKKLPAILDSDVLQPTTPNINGVYGGKKVLCVSLSDLGYMPVINQHLNIDGDIYIVTDCADEAGMLQITLEANWA